MFGFPKVSFTTSGTGTTETLKDNYIPVFSNRPADYKDWRARIMLYFAKMKITKREQEATLNLMTSLTGMAWR